MIATPVRTPCRHRGLVAVQVLVTLVVLLGCAALSVDVGYIYNSRGEMQGAVDASALAGSSALRHGHGLAKNRAIEYAANNVVAGADLASGELVITIGNWSGLSATFVPASESDTVTANAVRVVGERSGVPLFFAGILGVYSTTLNKGATAVQGGGHCLGIWGLEGITGSGDVTTDSYDLRLGGYNAGNIHANGDICSCADIRLGGNTLIQGDTIYGEGYGLTLVGSSNEIWGVVAEQDCNFTPPTIDMPGAAADNDNDTIGLTDDGDDPLNPAGRLFLTGNDNLTLAPGKYYFTSVRIVSLATLTITGPTEIYVSGTAYFGGGGIINPTGIPGNLKIYLTGATATFSGTSDFYGAIIAPDTDITFLGDSAFYGVLIGKTLDFRGSAIIHVEESLVADLYGLESVAPVLVQ
ncbi:MAG: hypothetical protein IIC01_05890 [Planctomycetes bacterium]|nr:hypothetical protein [Planctomycetota bacterium]